MNKNCLEGMRCPKCGSFEPFKIAITTFCFVYDDGTEQADADVGWDSDSDCVCHYCDHAGIVKDFYVDEPEETSDA